MTAQAGTPRMGANSNGTAPRMRRIGKWLAGLLVLAAAVIVVVVTIEDRAAGRAMAFCERFKPGTAFEAVRQAARTEFDRQFVTLQDEVVTVSIYGAVPPSLHLCTVKAKDGKVVQARYSHED